MFLNVCKQTFHVSHVHISQKLKEVLLRNLWHIIFIYCEIYDISFSYIEKSMTYHFHIKKKILTDFHICVSVPLSSACLFWENIRIFLKKLFWRRPSVSSCFCIGCFIKFRQFINSQNRLPCVVVWTTALMQMIHAT